MATITFAVFTIFLATSIYGNFIRSERDVIPLPKLTCNDIKCPQGYHCVFRNCSLQDTCGASICCRPDITVGKRAIRACEPLDFIRNTNMCPRGYLVDRTLSLTDQCCWNVNCTKCIQFECPSCCFSSINQFGCATCNCGIVPCPVES